MYLESGEKWGYIKEVKSERGEILKKLYRVGNTLVPNGRQTSSGVSSTWRCLGGFNVRDFCFDDYVFDGATENEDYSGDVDEIIEIRLLVRGFQYLDFATDEWLPLENLVGAYVAAN